MLEMRSMMKKLRNEKMKLCEKNGPKGVLLDKFCCVSFKYEGKYRGSTKLCKTVKGKENIYAGFIVGFCPTHWDMWDARTFDDVDNIGKVYVIRGCKLKKGINILEWNFRSDCTELHIVMARLETLQQKKQETQ